MIEIYGIKNCDSVKKTLNFFKKYNLPYHLNDFKEKKVECHQIYKWLEDNELKKLFNSRSTSYRNLKLKEMILSDDDKIQWLCKENLLIKRPVVQYNNKTLIAFNEEEYKKNFLK